MKRKLITLMTLLLCVCSGAWADTDVPVTYTYESSASKATMSTNAFFSAASNPTVTTNGSFAPKNGGLQCNVTASSSATVTFTFTAKADINLSSFTFYSCTGSNAINAATVDYYKNSETPVNTNVTFTKSTPTDDIITPESPISLSEGDIFTVKVNLTNTDTAKSRDWQLKTITLACTLAAEPTITAVNAASITATTSGVDATETIDITGANLTASGTLTATLSPAIDGLDVDLDNDDISAGGAITATATLTYNRTTNVKQGTTTLTISDGTTSKDITITYYAKVEDWTLQSISESTTWSFDDDNITSGTQEGGATTETVYANIEGMFFSSAFDGTALAVQGNYPYYSNGNQHLAQAKLLKFNTTIRGKVTVSYSSPNSSTAYISVNGGDNGSTISATTTEAITVSPGDVAIRGYSDEEHNTESLLNFTQVVFTATPYTITYDANGAQSGTVPTDANYYASGETVTVLGNTGSLTKEGKVFGGWNTAANGSGTSYAADATFNISDNVTLYAQWIEPVLVAYPDGSRTGYSCVGTTETPSSSGYTLKDVTVYQIQSEKSVTLTVPATTKISKIVVSGTSSSDNTSASYITISRETQTKDVTLNGRKQDLVSEEFVPTSQSTTYTITQKDGTSKNSWITISVYGTENVAKIGATKWGTFSSTSATTFPVDGITAYKVASIGEGIAVVESVTGDVLANTGLLLYGNEGEYTIPVANTDGSSVGDNLMTAGTGANITSGYVLSGKYGDFRLVPDGGVVIPYGKAYLSSTPNAHSLSIVFDEESTGISTIESENGSLLSGDFYNVAGQRVAKPTKGLYIVNGKKVIIK